MSELRARGRITAASGVPEAPAVRRQNSFRVLRRRNFALFWTAGLLSNTGTWMQTVAVPFVLFELTHSTVWLGVGALASLGTGLLMGPIAGLLADRFSRRLVLFMTQAGQMLAAFALFAVWKSGLATPGLIVGILVVSGAAGGLGIASWQALVPQLVEPDELLDGVRINSLQFMGARAFGPALAGLVLEVFGPSGAFLINAISFLIVLVALLAVRPRPVPRAQGQWRVLDHFREGLRYLLARESLWLAVVVMFFISFFPSAVLQLAPAIAKEFDVGQGAYGLIVALFGGGAIVGSVFVAMFADRFRRSALVIAGSISIGSAVVALGLAPSYPVVLVCLGWMGISYITISTALSTSIQARVDELQRGRVISLYLMGLQAGIPLGALLQGKLAELIGLRDTFIAAGVAMIAVILTLAATRNSLRAIDQTIERGTAHADPLLVPNVVVTPD